MRSTSSPRRQRRKSYIWMLAVLMLPFLVMPAFQSYSHVLADEPTLEIPPTVEPTAAPTELPTEAATATEVPAETPTEWVEVTEEPAEVVTITPEVTETPAASSTPALEITEEASEAVGEGDMSAQALEEEPLMSAQASVSCQLDINDAGDTSPFTFNFAAINTQGIIGYSWDFGDSGTAVGATASHTYTATGSFTITLTCITGTGTDITLNGNVTISNTINAGFTVSPGSSGYAPFTVQLTNTSSGGGLSFSWSVTGPETFSSTDPNPTFTFTQAGSYTITLTVTDGVQAPQTAQAVVAVQIPPPSANFTLSQTTGSPPLTIQVMGVDEGAGPITTWSWDFGDGSAVVTGQGAHNHIYSTPGNYWIVLTYSGPGGGGTVSKMVGVYDLIDPVDADFTYALQGNVPGGVRVCYTNTSTGPVVTNTWDFGDGSPVITDNSSVVCHVYASEANYAVLLTAYAANPAVYSEAQYNVNVIAAPNVQFTASSNSILWADTVNFDSSATTGATSYAWDFNNDGVIDSTDPNPSYTFNTVGYFTIRLTGTGPGGTGTAEMNIQVSQRPITCDFTGALSAVPGDSRTYISSIGGANGRTITYNWTISGPGGTTTYTTQNVTRAWTDEGAYLVTLSATASDGVSCSQSKTVHVAYPPLVCTISGNLNPAPNGTSHTYTANVTGLAGRPVTYTWFVNGVEQVGQHGTTFTRSWLAEVTENISFTVTLANGTGCGDDADVVVEWPDLICSISGQPSPIPALPDDPARSYTYTANVTGLAGRTATYAWYVDGVLQAGVIGNTLTLSWAWNQEGTKNITFDVVSSITSTSCLSGAASLSVDVDVPNLTCSLVGDVLPALGETVNYSLNLGSRYGRTITGYTWSLEKSDGAGGWIPLINDTASGITYTFSEPGAVYRISYSVDVTQPDHNCSGTRTIQGAGVGADFLCDAGPIGNLAPSSSSSNYTYQVEIDNTLGFDLEYTWVLVDYLGVERILDTNTSTIDGWVTSPAINGSLFTPADNYTLRVDVKALNPADSAHSCSLSAALVAGTLNVDYTYTGNANAIEVDQEICLTNTSNTSHGDINALTYSWDFGTATNSLGTQTSTDQQPGCISFPNPGTYTIRLTGTNASGLRTANRQVTFHVYGHQSIAINHANVTHAPASNMAFSAIATNVTAPFNWTFRNLDTNTVIGTRTGQNTTFTFSTPARYEVVVTASGPLGPTTATTTFTLLGVDDIRAAFRPSAFGGLAPMHVCFTDRSVGNGINSWSWDFGNGQTLSYTLADKPDEVCTDYTTPATSYLAQLTVGNAAGNTASATNVIRTFNIVEAGATFRIIPQGAGLYCFQPEVDAGITVTGWEYGDGTVNTTTNLNYPCYTYQSSGSYLVTMHITDGSTTGSVTRPLDVDLTTSAPPPVLSVVHGCLPDGSAIFTVTNNGGAMTVFDRVTIEDASGNLLLADDFLLLAGGGSTTYTISGYYGVTYLETLDTAAAQSGDCDEPPMLSGTSSCAADGTAIFNITNNSADTAANQPYEVRNASNVVVASGMVTTAANGGTQQITVSGYYGALTFTTSGGVQGATTNVTLNTNCNQPPVLAATGSCAVDGTAIFDITNTSQHLAANQPYEIHDAGGALVQSGTITAAANGGTQQILVHNVYGPLTLTSDGGAQGATTVISADTDCNEPPMLSGTSACAADGTAIFNIRNDSADTAANQSYEVRNASNVVVASGMVTAAANGGTQQITVSGHYGALTFTTSGGALGSTTNVTLNTNCDEPPVLSAVPSCQIDGTAVFDITNTSQHLAANQPYEIHDAGGALVQSGTITAAANGGTQQILVHNVYGPLTLTSDGGAQGATTVISADTDCDEPPMLSGRAYCEADGTTVFIITNNSADTAASQPYEIRDLAGRLVETGTLNVATNGGRARFTITDRFVPMSFTTSGIQGVTTEVTLYADCKQPVFAAAIEPTPEPTVETNPSQGENRKGGKGTRHFLPLLDLTPGEVDPSLPRPEAWEGIQIGAAVCPDWLLYHTNMTGDWEVFRLGDLPEYPLADPNLSQGRGVDVVDMAPTRSPDSHWVAFTTNRDGNWELYVTKVDNSEWRRLTYNTVAKDIDPTWSPDGRYIAFESDRDGNWELYLFDVVTGEEIRLTDNPANDINAYWSSDSKKIVFQSDRDGLWQVYELQIATGEQTRLSDGQGDDHDPVYSFSDEQVTFRSYRNDDPHSVIYVMNADGSGVEQISPSGADSSNHTWYLDDSIIAYQSDLDGDNDIYVYEFESKTTRLVTDNDIEDYAPAWICDAPVVVFTSDVTDDPNIYNTPALPIDAPAILVDEEAIQMTFDPGDDVYPENSPTEENASREGNVPPRIGE
jgi:PKD repeat protein/Tol biopolymer transport system component